ncbi:MAG: cytochrome c3 family protein [Pseudomonadota bacterium]
MKIKTLAAAVATASLTLASAGAMAAITGSKHDLTAAAAGKNSTTGTNEICVFCHTPHGSDTSASVPLWNRKMAAPTTYTTYASLNTVSLDGTIAPVGSVSLACLSCHDGTQAMDALINAPGSGGYSMSAPDQAWTWATGGTADLTGRLASGVANLGQDLRNDHPVGVQYAGGGATATNLSNFRDPDFKPLLTSTINGNQVWWVDSGTVTGSRDKSDMILYSRNDFPGATGVMQPSVECASCHDPHAGETASVSPPSVAFLRMSNAGSAVCLACHVK